MNKKRPFMVIAGGFVFGEVLILQAENGWLWIVLFALAAAGAELMRSRSAYHRAFLLFLALLMSGLLGGARGSQVKLRLDKEEAWASTLEDREVLTLCGRIASSEEREGNCYLVLEDGTVEENSEAIFGKIWVFIEGDEAEREALFTGKQVKILGELQPIEGIKNPGEFDFRAYYRAKKIACRFYGKVIREVRGEEIPYFGLLRRAKEKGRAILADVCEEQDAMIYRAMLLGESSSMDTELKNMYRRAGIAHLLAISGQHLAIVGGGLYVLLRRLGLGFRSSAAAGAVLVISYGILTGGSGSAMRAVIMLLCLWLAAVFGRTYDTLSALSLGAILLLWDSPYLVFQSGFQLSFGAVFAIAGVGKWLQEALGLEKGWQKTLLISICVQLVLTPVMLWHYYEYPLYGIVMNLIVLPLVPVLMYSGILALAAGGFCREAGVAAVGAGHDILECYHSLCSLAEKLPGYCLVIGRPKWRQIMLYYGTAALALGALWFWQNRRKKRRKEEPSDSGDGKEAKKSVWRQVVSLLATALLYVICFLFLLPLPVKGLTVFGMDVGQGDGFILQTERQVVLIDGGSSSEKNLGSMSLIPYLKSRGISTVDCAVVSHGDHDHISGLLTLLEEEEELTVATLVLPKKGRGEEIYEKLEVLTEKRGGKVVYLETGDVITAGKLTLSCIYAGEGVTSTDRNSQSLVLCADYGDFHMLFTGDMGTEEERALLSEAEKTEGAYQRGHLSHVNILKIAHHGSSGSSCLEFLERMPLRAAVVSYGKGNSYGHPSKEVMERLRTLGVPVWEIGKDGAWTVKSK